MIRIAATLVLSLALGQADSSYRQQLLKWRADRLAGVPLTMKPAGLIHSRLALGVWRVADPKITLASVASMVLFSMQ